MQKIIVLQDRMTLWLTMVERKNGPGEDGRKLRMRMTPCNKCCFKILEPPTLPLLLAFETNLVCDFA